MPKTLITPVKIFLLAITLILLSLFIYNSQKENHKIENYQIPAASPKPQLNENLKAERAGTITAAIQSTLAKAQGRYSIYIKDLKYNQTFEYKSQEFYTSASVYKLAVMYKTFDALEKNDIEKEDILSTINTDSPKKFSYSIGEALRLMITVSDNTSATLLAEKLGWVNIEKFLVEVGIENFKLTKEPESTAVSTAQILERIYTGNAVSKQASNDMKKLLLAQTVNDRIPKYLPKNIKVAHKTGELDTLRHDAGIVYGKKSDYIFVFFSDSPKPEVASETIAMLAKIVFDLLEVNSLN